MTTLTHDKIDAMLKQGIINDADAKVLNSQIDSQKKAYDNARKTWATQKVKLALFDSYVKEGKIPAVTDKQISDALKNMKSRNGK